MSREPSLKVGTRGTRVIETAHDVMMVGLQTPLRLPALAGQAEGLKLSSADSGAFRLDCGEPLGLLKP